MGTYGARYGDRYDLKPQVVGAVSFQRRSGRPKRAYPKQLQYSSIEGIIAAKLIHVGPTSIIISRALSSISGRIYAKLTAQILNKINLPVFLSLEHTLNARMFYRLTLEIFKKPTLEEKKTKKILATLVASMIADNNAQLDELE